MLVPHAVVRHRASLAHRSDQRPRVIRLPRHTSTVVQFRLPLTGSMALLPQAILPSGRLALPRRGIDGQDLALQRIAFRLMASTRSGLRRRAQREGAGRGFSRLRHTARDRSRCWALASDQVALRNSRDHAELPLASRHLAIPRALRRQALP